MKKIKDISTFSKKEDTGFWIMIFFLALVFFGGMTGFCYLIGGKDLAVVAGGLIGFMYFMLLATG